MRRLCAGLGLVCALLSACTHGPIGERHDIQTESDQTETQRRAAIRLQLAAAYLEAGQATVALDEVKQALAIDASMPAAYHLRALAYMNLNERELAQQSFERALTMRANDSDLFNNYGWFLCLGNQYEAALSWFNKAIATLSAGGSAKPLANVGMCYLRQGKQQLAESYFLKALELDVNHPVANSNLALLCFKRGENQRARSYIQRVNNSAYQNPESLWLGARIAHRQGDSAQQEVWLDRLRERFPDSREMGAYERGAWDE